jgi:hypothetical protein
MAQKRRDTTRNAASSDSGSLSASRDAAWVVNVANQGRGYHQRHIREEELPKSVPGDDLPTPEAEDEDDGNSNGSYDAYRP